MYEVSDKLLKLTSCAFEHINRFQMFGTDCKSRIDDIIDHKSIEELLLNREILIEILETLPVGIQIIDENGIIVFVNSAFLNTLNVKPQERIGKSIVEVSPDGSLSKVLRTRKPVINIRNSPKGTPVELVSSAMPLYYSGDFIGAVAIMHDVKDVFSLTEQLKESRHMVKDLSEKISQLSKATYSFDDIISNSYKMKKVIEISKIAAQNDSPVLILGETGTGKELIANSIHNASKRSQQPFICINCSAIPENLLESELFGHEKGAFSGAIKRKLGKFELANKGTLFLDEIGDMSLSLQPKLLRAIQEKKIQRIGGENEIELDFRIIAATNRDLKKMVSKGQFREDLYYRLNVISIEIPPLRERKEDLIPLVHYLSNKICRKLGKRIVSFSDEAIRIMHEYSWPGNVRELENIVERAIIGLVDRDTVEAKDLSYLIVDNNPDKGK